MNVFDEVRHLKPLQAVRSVRALIANPENTGEVFKIIEALKGGSLARAVARMEADPQGLALLRSKPEILRLLSDREVLRPPVTSEPRGDERRHRRDGVPHRHANTRRRFRMCAGFAAALGVAHGLGHVCPLFAGSGLGPVVGGGIRRDPNVRGEIPIALDERGAEIVPVRSHGVV